MTPRLRSWFAGLSLAVASTLLPAQSSGSPTGDPSVAPQTGALRNLSNYLIQAGDALRVQVFQEPDLSQDLARVQQDNTITLPLIGRISTRGKSVQDLEREIREAYDRDFLVNPQITVTVLQYTSRTVSVMGAVNSPGVISFPPEEPMRLLDAISRAGGFSRLGDPRRVLLSRTLPDGTIRQFEIDAQAILNGRNPEQWVLQKDDVINVRETIL